MDQSSVIFIQDVEKKYDQTVECYIETKKGTVNIEQEVTHPRLII